MHLFENYGYHEFITPNETFWLFDVFSQKCYKTSWLHNYLNNVLMLKLEVSPNSFLKKHIQHDSWFEDFFFAIKMQQKCVLYDTEIMFVTLTFMIDTTKTNCRVLAQEILYCTLENCLWVYFLKMLKKNA